MKNSQLIACYNKKVALYNKMKSQICKKYKIAQTSFDILLFLYNNRDVRTAEKICRLRAIKPAIVSVEIDKLIKAGYVTREVDSSDRRRQLLTLTDLVETIANDGKKMQQYFNDILFEGLTVEESKTYLKVLDKMLININNCEKEGFNFVDEE